MVRATITLPEELDAIVRREARRRDSSYSATVRQLIYTALSSASRKPRQLAWAGMVDDPGLVFGRDLDKALDETWADDIDRDRG